MEKTAYEILGVSPTATDEEIKRQYHTLIRDVHDSLGTVSTEIQAKVREYNSAYDKLNSEKRAAYDETLRSRCGGPQEDLKEWQDDSKWSYHESLGLEGEKIGYWSFKGSRSYTDQEQSEIRQESFRREQARMQAIDQQESSLETEGAEQAINQVQSDSQIVEPKSWEDDSKWSYQEDLGPNGERLGIQWKFVGDRLYTDQEQETIMQESIRREQLRLQQEEQLKEEKRRKDWADRQKEFLEFEKQNALFGNIERKQRELGQEFPVLTSLGSQTGFLERPKPIVVSSPVSNILEKLVESRLQELFDILGQNYSFCGSYTVDSSQKLRQDYWKLKSKRDKLERDLRTAEQDATIEFMKKSPTNEIQLNIDFRNLSSKIASFELKRNTDLASAQQNYVFKASKRFITQRKREMLKQQLEQEEAQVNAKYDMMIEMHREKQNQNRMKLGNYQKDVKKAVERDPHVLKIKEELSQVQFELNSIGERLGYQPRTSDYTSSYGERSRVSV